MYLLNNWTLLSFFLLCKCWFLHSLCCFCCILSFPCKKQPCFIKKKKKKVESVFIFTGISGWLIFMIVLSFNCLSLGSRNVTKGPMHIYPLYLMPLHSRDCHWQHRVWCASNLHFVLELFSPSLPAILWRQHLQTDD